MRRLEGKVVLLTGASSGIGWEAALLLGAAGARLALLARRKDKLEELAARLPESAQALLIPGDVAELEKAPERVRAVTERFGHLDVLINNAGVTAFRHFERQDPAEIETLIRVNYLGAAALIRAALPNMLARREGHVVNVASIAGLFGTPQLAAYSASKHALVGLTEALRREHYASGVAFTAFCPGSVDTPMTERVLADPALRRLSRPYSAEAMAALLVEACRRRPPLMVRGESPGILLHLSRLAPRLTDWAVHQIFRRFPPLAAD